MIRLAPLLLVAPLLLAGCAVVNPSIDQLQGFKAAAARGEHATIAATPVSCAAGAPGCAQLHAIKADACRRTAAGPLSDQRARLDCAAREYEAASDALARTPDPELDPAQPELGALDALQRRRDLADSAPDADAANAALLARANATRRGLRADPAGLTYAADATLNAALRLPPAAAACPAIADAARLLGAAHPANTAFAGPAARLATAISNARTARRCPA